MSLFLKVETRSKLLGNKERDVVLIAVDRIHKIESFGESGGCVITHGTPAERTTCDVCVTDLLNANLVDITKLV
jgi:hypothetical protein